jgi:hypothetical protein|tara:strand:- start:401 stop:715 length:315 start_codon:yes stop_codon:yes gene_type:complete
MASLQDALIHFNTDKPAWYGWKDSKDGEVYSNLKLLDDTATMPSEEDVNSKIAELDIDAQRVMEYGSIGDQLDKLYHDIDNGKLDETGEWFKAIKKVKDDNPKG